MRVKNLKFSRVNRKLAHGVNTCRFFQVGRTFSMNLILFSLISSFSSICVLYFVVKCVTYLLLHCKRYIIFWICESVSTIFSKKCTFTIDDWNEITNELKQFWNWELKKN